MGTGTQVKYNEGDTAPPAEHNDLVDAICGDMVPRDPVTYIPGDLKGKLGNSNFRWDQAHIKKLLIGEVADAMSMEDDGAGNLIVKLSGVTIATFKPTGIDRSSISTANYVVGSTTSSFSTASGTPATVCSVTITTVGKPVFVGLLGTDSNSFLKMTGSGPTDVILNAILQRDSVTIAEQDFVFNLGSGASAQMPASAFWMMDFGANAGSHTYDFQTACGSGSSTVSGSQLRLVAFEMV